MLVSPSPLLRPALRRLRSRALLVLLALAAAGSATLAWQGPRLGAQSLDLGEENSWVRIQNVGINRATIDVRFYDLEGRQIATDACPLTGGCGTLPPGFGWSFFQQGFQRLPAGYRGSAFVTVDQPFVSLLARDAFKDGRFQIGGDTLRLGAGSATQYAPVVQNTAGYVSRLSVENARDNADACVEIRYYRVGSLLPAAVDPPGPTAGCPAGGRLLKPRGTLVADERNLPVPFGFDGSALVRTYRSGSGVAAVEQRPAAMVDTRAREGFGLASSRALDGLELSRVVVLPLADRGGGEHDRRWGMRFRVMNADPSVPNELKLRFEGTDGNGDRVEIDHTVVVIAALTCDLRAGAAGACLPPDRPLPATFVGTVRMQAVEPIAVVAQRFDTGGALSDYRGFTAEEASRQVVLPVLNRNFGPWGDATGWNSWFRVLTFDGSTAHLRVVYYSKQFPDGLITLPVTVERERSFRQWEEVRLPDGWVGSAIVVADRPVVVVVSLESDLFQGDPVMMYNGVSLE